MKSLKWIAVIVIAAILIIWGVSAYTTADGEPDTKMVVQITNTETGTVYYATINMDEAITSGSLFGGYAIPFTTYSAEVPPIDLTGIYEISFVVTTSITNAEELATIETQTIRITNVQASTVSGIFYSESGDTHATITETNLDPAILNEITVPPFVDYQYVPEGGAPGAIQPIRGSWINNSEFTLLINVDATDADGFPTSKSITSDITIIINTPTEINLVVDNIGVDLVPGS